MTSRKASESAVAMASAAAAAPRYPAIIRARGPNRSASAPVSGLSTAGGTDQHTTVTEIASGLALNR
jgi:hypothetical protein